MIKKKKLKKGQQYVLRNPCKNISEIQVNKIEPQTDIRENLFLKIDKSAILQNQAESKRSFYSTLHKKYKEFRHSLAEL